MKKIIVPNNIEIVISSFGGVGTSFLLEYFENYARTNSPSDLDFVKHSSVPPISFNRNVKFVYIYGDPILATVSLFRREYHYYQSRKLSFYKSAKSMPENLSLADYAKGQKDYFYFEEHFNNWHTKFLTHPTCFIKYEKLDEVKEELIEFLELPKDSLKNFPAFIERNSNLEKLDKDTHEGLKLLYGDFADKLSSMKDFEVRLPKRQALYWLKYFNKLYTKALLNQFFSYTGVKIRRKFPTLFWSLNKLKPKSWRI